MIEMPVDATPVVQISALKPQPSSLASQQFLGSPEAASSQTQFASLGDRSPVWVAMLGTGETTSGTVLRNASVVKDQVERLASADVLNAASVRSLMLARKFGAGVDKEEVSRIEILTARLRKLNPRVTGEQIDFQAEMVGNVEAISSKLASLRERLNSL